MSPKSYNLPCGHLGIFCTQPIQPVYGGLVNLPLMECHKIQCDISLTKKIAPDYISAGNAQIVTSYNLLEK